MALDEWRRGIADLSGNEIQAALEHCRNELDWPPSIAAFRKAAKGHAEGKDWQHSSPAYRIVNPRQLLKCDPTPKTQAAAVTSFAAMREKLRGS